MATFKENFDNRLLNKNKQPEWRDRVCPICNKEAKSKYYNDSKKKWIYSHGQRFAASIEHEADK